MRTDHPFQRATGLRHVFKVKGEEGREAPGKWLAWAQRCRIEAFVALGRNLKRYRAEIDATLDCGLTDALIESTNTKIRLLTRVAFGFHDPTPSSPWPCSPSAATAPRSPEDDHEQTHRNDSRAQLCGG